MNQTGKFFRSRTERFAFLEKKIFPGINKQRITIRELRYSLRLKIFLKFDFQLSGLLSYQYRNGFSNTK
jgi:hypothetical protein